jgi:tetratricopeptide (TPR) repeat protein
LPKGRAAANKALALDPRNAAAVTALATADYLAGDIAKARAGVARALELDPSNAMAHLLYGAMLPLKQGLVQFKEAARLAPDSTGAQNTLASTYADHRDWPAALRTYRTLNKVAPNPVSNAVNLAFIYSQMQRDQQAVEVFDQLHPATSVGKQNVAAFKLTYPSRLQPALKPQALAAVDKLPGRKTGAAGVLIQLYMALDAKAPAMQLLPGFCAIDRFNCGDLGVSPMFTALHGDPRFEQLVKQYGTMMDNAAPASASSG